MAPIPARGGIDAGLRSSVGTIVFWREFDAVTGFRELTDEAFHGVNELNDWANIPLGGSSAMPFYYRAIKDWLMGKQRDARSVYSCF
jgi:hypothetical protein